MEFQQALLIQGRFFATPHTLVIHNSNSVLDYGMHVVLVTKTFIKLISTEQKSNSYFPDNQHEDGHLVKKK